MRCFMHDIIAHLWYTHTKGNGEMVKTIGKHNKLLRNKQSCKSKKRTNSHKMIEMHV